MKLKQVSKRQWKARMMLGRWLPMEVIMGFSFSAPDGHVFVWHPEMAFLKLVPEGEAGKLEVAIQAKKAWE